MDEDSGGAFMVWESNGPGRTFGKVVMRTGFGHFYWRTNEYGAKKRRTDHPGWHKDDNTGMDVLSAFRTALKTGDLIVRNGLILDECSNFIYDQNGKPVHEATIRSEDPTGARDNHGDRVIASSLMWMGMSGRYGMGGDRTKEKGKDKGEPVLVSPNSFAGRQRAAQRKRKDRLRRQFGRRW